eukprot:scaffold14111_cov133-Cylindrotheca_fusiformis.AAC.2
MLKGSVLARCSSIPSSHWEGQLVPKKRSRIPGGTLSPPPGTPVTRCPFTPVTRCPLSIYWAESSDLFYL